MEVQQAGCGDCGVGICELVTDVLECSVTRDQLDGFEVRERKRHRIEESCRLKLEESLLQEFDGGEDPAATTVEGCAGRPRMLGLHHIIGLS